MRAFLLSGAVAGKDPRHAKWPGGLLALGRFHGAGVGCLGVFLAGALGVAAQVVALFLGHVVIGVGAGFTRFFLVAGRGFVLGLQLGLGHMFLALGFFLAHVFGVAGQALALFLVGF